MKTRTILLTAAIALQPVLFAQTSSVKVALIKRPYQCQRMAANNLILGALKGVEQRSKN